MEGLTEFLATVGSHLLDFDGQLREHMVDGLDGGLLVVIRMGPHGAQPGAVIDRGVLAMALLPGGPAQRLNEFHVNLQLVARSLLLITFALLVIP